jgi:hypothetical protein
MPVLTPIKTKKAFGFYFLVKHAERKTWDSPTLAEPAPTFTQPVSPKKKIRKPALHTLLPWYNHHFVEQSCVKWTNKVKKKAGSRRIFFWVFLPPFFRVRSVTTRVEMRVVNDGHESRMSTACTFSFLSACASVYGQQGMALQFRSGPEGPRGGGGAPPWAPWVPPTARESPGKHDPKKVF